jgi:hypothetical protein
MAQSDKYFFRYAKNTHFILWIAIEDTGGDHFPRESTTYLRKTMNNLTLGKKVYVKIRN